MPNKNFEKIDNDHSQLMALLAKDCVIPHFEIGTNSKYTFTGFMNTIEKRLIESGKLISSMLNNYQFPYGISYNLLPDHVFLAFSSYCFPTTSNNPEFDYYYIFRLLCHCSWISDKFPGMMAELTYGPLNQYQQPRVNQWLKYKTEVYILLQFMGLPTGFN